MLEIPDEKSAGDRQEGTGNDGDVEKPHPARGAQPPQRHQQHGHQVDAGGDPLGQGVEAHAPVPRHAVRDVVGEHGGGATAAPTRRPSIRTGRAPRLEWLARDDVLAAPPLLAPREEAAGRPAGGQRIEGRLVGAAVEELRPRLLLRAAHRDRLAMDDPRHLRGRVVEVPDQDGLGGTDHDAGRLEADVQAVRAEVALLGRVVLGIDEDGVVGTGGDAGLAADADRLVEVDDAVGPPEHRAGWAGGRAGGVVALVAARHLKRSARLGEDPDVHVLDVGAGDPERDLVLGLAGRGAGVAADAALVVDDFGPDHWSRPCLAGGEGDAPPSLRWKSYSSSRAANQCTTRPARSCSAPSRTRRW